MGPVPLGLRGGLSGKSSEWTTRLLARPPPRAFCPHSLIMAPPPAARPLPAFREHRCPCMFTRQPRGRGGGAQSRGVPVRALRAEITPPRDLPSLLRKKRLAAVSGLVVVMEAVRF